MKNKGYSKAELKARRMFKMLLTLVILIVIITICFFAFVVFKNNFVTENVSREAYEVSDDVVKNATPIILNNVVLGATYKNTWVASESYYFRNSNKITEVDVYNEKGKKGKYKVENYTNSDSSGSFYVDITKPNGAEEFFAIGSSENNVMTNGIAEVTIEESDIEVVKKALGMYMLLNTSVKINSIHNVTFDAENRGRVLCVTNKPGESSGAYSAVIYQKNNGDTKIVKYNYIKNLKEASDWPIYSLKFVADLNSDGMSDIILQETKEFETKYDVIEYKNDKFVEVLSTNVKI